MPQVALMRRIGRVCVLGGLFLALCAAGCSSDKLKKEIEDKNKAIAQLDELKNKAEADLAAKDQELRLANDKLQKQATDSKRLLDGCTATVTELRDKVKSLSRAAKSDKAKDAAAAKDKAKKTGNAKRSGR